MLYLKISEDTLHGDLLWFSTPQSNDGRLIFKPNVTTYSVDSKSDIGKKIINYDVGIVVHVVIDLEGNKSQCRYGTTSSRQNMDYASSICY